MKTIDNATVRYVSLQIRSNHYFLENLSYCETPLNIGGLSVKFWDFSEILQLFLYWKFGELCAWVVDRDSVLVHHGLGEVMATQFAEDGHASDSGGQDLTTGVWKAKEGQLVRHRECYCTQRR
jgi:hypothetical protein